MMIGRGGRFQAAAFLWGSVVAVAAAAPMSERDIVMMAVRRNSGILLQAVDRKVDSLELADVQGRWLPGLKLQVEGSPMFPDSQTTMRVSANATQLLAGGGSLTASLGDEILYDWSVGDSKDRFSPTRSFQVSMRQPLLRNAWRFGAQDMAVRLRRLDHQQFLLNQKQEILSTLSQGRRLYWGLYEKKKMVGISLNDRDYSARRLDTQRKRLSLGDATPLDTLSAALDFLRAQQGVLNAQNDVVLAVTDLALFLGMPRDSLEIDTSQAVVVKPLPPPQEFLDMVRQFDPRLEVFDILDKKLQLDRQRARNQLLPDITAEASYSHDGSGENTVVSLIAAYALPTRSPRISLAKSRLALEQSALRREEYRRDLVKKVETLGLQWERECDNQRISAAAVVIARKEMEAALAGFEVGTVDNLTLLKAQNDYARTAAEKLSGEVALKRIEIAFDEITGAVLTDNQMEW